MFGKPDAELMPSISLRKPIHPDIAFPLASIVIEWSEVEQAIDADIATLAKTTCSANAAERANQGFKDRLVQWKRMFDRVYDVASPRRQVTAAIYFEAEALSELRNCLLHGVWCQPQPQDDVDYEILWTRKAQKDPDPSHRDVRTLLVDAAYLSALHQRVSRLREALTDLMIERSRQLIPSPVTIG